MTTKAYGEWQTGQPISAVSGLKFALRPHHVRRLRLGEEKKKELEMWANAQRDARPAEYRWRPLFNAAKFG